MIAAYFAVFDESNNNEDGAIWEFSTGSYTSNPDMGLVNTLDDLDAQQGSYIYYPRAFTKRTGSQRSCFIVKKLHAREDEQIDLEQEVNNNTNLGDKIKKYIIPKEKKKLIKLQLMECGINALSIYSDLSGLCEKIK